MQKVRFSAVLFGRGDILGASCSPSPPSSFHSHSPPPRPPCRRRSDRAATGLGATLSAPADHRQAGLHGLLRPRRLPAIRVYLPARLHRPRKRPSPSGSQRAALPARSCRRHCRPRPRDPQVRVPESVPIYDFEHWSPASP